MNRNIMLLAITSALFINSATLQAEYKIKFQQEKLPLKGVWTVDTYRYENWQDIDGLFDCGEWSPSADTKYQNTFFTQTASCSQKQERDVYVIEKFSVTEEERERFHETEEQIISKNKTQSIEGTKPPEYVNQCFYDYSTAYWQWRFDDSGGCGYSCTGIYAKTSENYITVRSIAGYHSDMKAVKADHRYQREQPDWKTSYGPVTINGGQHLVYRGALKYSSGTNYSDYKSKKWEVCIKPY